MPELPKSKSKAKAKALVNNLPVVEVNNEHVIEITKRRGRRPKASIQVEQTGQVPRRRPTRLAKTK